tara:strand:+ start:423 stop:701 length:279 start_codon:yes stop_codon:yes gene_type:complete
MKVTICKNSRPVGNYVRDLSKNKFYIRDHHLNSNGKFSTEINEVHIYYMGQEERLIDLGCARNIRNNGSYGFSHTEYKYIEVDMSVEICPKI